MSTILVTGSNPGVGKAIADALRLRRAEAIGTVLDAIGASYAR